MSLRRLSSVSLVALTASLLSVAAFANVEPTYEVPDSGISALALAGAIATVCLIRRRSIK